jgi:hypothetical protein
VYNTIRIMREFARVPVKNAEFRRAGAVDVRKP